VFALPYAIKFILDLFSLGKEYSQILTVSFFPFILFLIAIPLLYFANKNYFKIILKDIRLFRLLHYELMFVVGTVLALKISDFDLSVKSLFSFIFIPLSIAFAWIYSVMTNNIQDYAIDKISNQQRPLVQGKINPVLYNKIAWGFFFSALIYPGLVGFPAFFVILLFIGNYFLYSMPPFRLKRVPFFSKTLIALNSLILVMLGFTIVSGVSIENIPVSNSLFFLVLIILTGLINFIDIKDYEGDKQAGIKTLPVLLGLKRSKFIISIFFALTYLLICFLAKEIITLIFFLIAGGLMVYFINRVNYKEKYVFGIILASLFYIIFKFLFF
jgi:4-hydroxybenzoate polyprenyltransferase